MRKAPTCFVSADVTHPIVRGGRATMVAPSAVPHLFALLDISRIVKNVQENRRFQTVTIAPDRSAQHSTAWPPLYPHSTLVENNIMVFNRAG